MTRIKICGLSTLQDIQAANVLQPDYIGFVFAAGSRRYVSPQKALQLKQMLQPGIQAVGVFVREEMETIRTLVHTGVIDVVQLHGGEDETYVRRLRQHVKVPVLQAFRIDTEQDVRRAEQSTADCILLDSGAGGTGQVFNWALIQHIKRPYFLAGGLGPNNVEQAIARLHPYGVDVSSGLETDGKKDPNKMAAFVAMVRKEENT